MRNFRGVISENKVSDPTPLRMVAKELTLQIKKGVCEPKRKAHPVFLVLTVNLELLVLDRVFQGFIGSRFGANL